MARSNITSIGGDFVLDRVVPPQSIGVLIGEGGSGKTSFVTRYCPGPIAFFNFDGRSKKALDEAKETRGAGVIQEVKIDFPGNVLSMSKEEARRTASLGVKKTLRNLTLAAEAAKEGRIKTIAFDTGSEFNDLAQIYARGDVEVTRSDDRGASKSIINRQWLSVFQLVRECGANFIVLGRPKQKWVDNAPVAGVYTPYMPDVVMDATDWMGHIMPVVTPGSRNKEADINFEIKIRKATEISELGKTYKSEEWDLFGGPFAYISMQMYPKVNRKVWLP